MPLNPPTIEFKDPHWSVTLIDSTLGVQHVSVQSLVDELDRFAGQTPLALFEVKVDTVDPTRYQYTWTTKNGRSWSQWLKKNEAGRWLQSFNVTDYFEEGEFSGHRTVRTAVLPLLDLGCTKIEATWT